RGNVQLQPLGGLFERRVVQEAADSLPLFRGDLQHQCVMQAVKQVDRVDEGLIVRGKGGQDLEFKEAVGLDLFQRPARELKGFTGEPVDRRLNAVGNFTDADAHAEG